MTSIRTVFRPSSCKTEEAGKLSLRILHQREYKLISTGLSLKKEEWDIENQYPIFYIDDTKQQEALQQTHTKLEFQIQQLLTIVDNLGKKGVYTVDDILTQYKLRTEKNSFSQFIDVLSRDLVKQNQERTARAYESVRKRFIKFNKGKDIPLHHLNTLIVHQFEKQLKEEGLKPNTTSFYMRNLRAIFNKAITQGLIAHKVNPFIGVFTGLAPTTKRALSVDELSQLKKLDLNHIFEGQGDVNKPEWEQLAQAKDLFLFAFHTRGMSFVDIAFLKKENIKDGVITYRRRKTGQQLEIALTDSLSHIINCYKEETKESEYVFPIITKPNKSPIKQYQHGLARHNKFLKRLAKLSGIRKNLSSHMARHTWATIAKGENLPIWVISESLGHSSVKTTYIYLASFNRSILDDANDKVSMAVGF